MARGGVVIRGASSENYELTGSGTSGQVLTSNGAGADPTFQDASSGTPADDSVTNAKLANMAQATIKLRADGAGTGDPIDGTGTQATAILDVMVGDSGSGGTKGLVPAPASGDTAAGKFLKANGTWAAPTGGGGGALGDLLDATVVVKASDESVTSSDVLQNDDALLFAIGAAETWVFEFVLFVEGNSTGDFKTALNGPASVTGYYMAIGVTAASDPAGGSYTGNASANYSAPGGFARGIGTGTACIVVKGIAIGGGTAGNIQLVWAQGTSNGTATTVKAGSYVEARRVA